MNPSVFVNRFGDLYREASRGDTCALKALAGVVAHEITQTTTKDEAEPTRVEMKLLDEFLEDPTIPLAERSCLIQRKKAVREHGRMK